MKQIECKKFKNINDPIMQSSSYLIHLNTVTYHLLMITNMIQFFPKQISASYLKGHRNSGHLYFAYVSIKISLISIWYISD
jgi:hypothetical protein